MYIRLIQAIAITAAFAGWIIYQMVVRKKRFFQLKDDILAIIFFATVWFGLAYFMSR
jgi:hypothetical protein